MNIALAPSEIATFLEITPEAVPQLWSEADLRRSIYVENRQTPELSHSSIFDVLEFHLRRDLLEAGEGSDSELDAWLSAVDELVESDAWDEAGFEELVVLLAEIYLDFSGAPCGGDVLYLRATHVLAAYFCLLGFVQRDSGAPDAPNPQLSA